MLIDINRPSRVRRLTTAVALAACLGVSLHTQGAGQDFETVARSGQQVPGEDSSVVFDNFFGAPVLNAAGQVSFIGILAGEGVDFSNNQGIYTGGPGTLTQIARTGNQAPGEADGVVFDGFIFFGNFDTPAINASGQTAFGASLIDPDTNTFSRSIYSNASGSLTQIARSGNEAPGTESGVVFDFFTNPLLSASGQTTFRSSLTEGDSIYRENSGVLTLVARTGDQAPGEPDGVSLGGFLGFRGLVSNASGQIAFSTDLITGSGIPPTAIYSDSAGTLTQIAREGNQAPGTGSGVVFDNLDAFGNLVINAAGQLAFHADLRDADFFTRNVDATNDAGIYSNVSGTLALVAREGDQAPGPEGDLVFSSFRSPQLNDAGQIAFTATLTGEGDDATNSSGIYATNLDSQLVEIVRAGDQAPDAVNGVVFRSFGFTTPRLNTLGQLVFDGLLTGESVDETNDRGIYATDLDGQLIEIAREGDLFDVNDDPLIDDLRTIQAATLFTLPDSGANGSAFNDLGQIAFRLDFTDGSSGIFISNLVAVPEPGSLSLLAIAGLGLLRRRRH